MKIEHGKSRISFVGDKYTLKIPRINLDIIKAIIRIINYSIINSVGYRKLFLSLGNNFSYWYNINYDNIMANIREYRLGRKFPEIVMRTRISCFMNIKYSRNMKSYHGGRKYFTMEGTYFFIIKS